MLPRSGPKVGLWESAALRVLLGEDDGATRSILQWLLRRLGHAVDAVADGPGAIEAASAAEFDLIILDVQMPGLGGLEVARELRGRRRGPRPRLVAMSAEWVGPVDSLAAGLDDFLIKPIRVADLDRIIRCIGTAAAPAWSPVEGLGSETRA